MFGLSAPPLTSVSSPRGKSIARILSRHLGGRRGGEGRDHADAQPLGQGSDPQVGGPEALAPLGDAVRLVHHEVRDAGGGEALQRAPDEAGLGGGQHEARCPAPRARRTSSACLRRGLPPRARRGHPRGSRLSQLVGEQRPQRHQHEGGAVDRTRRQLEAQRLARAGGQDHDLGSAPRGCWRRRSAGPGTGRDTPKALRARSATVSRPSGVQRAGCRVVAFSSPGCSGGRSSRRRSRLSSGENSMSSSADALAGGVVGLMASPSLAR